MYGKLHSIGVGWAMPADFGVELSGRQVAPLPSELKQGGPAAAGDLPMAKYLAFGALAVLLALALWAAYEQWIIQVVDVPGWGWAAIILGGGLSILVGAGLMALMFYSSRMGYDEPPHETKREDK